MGDRPEIVEQLLNVIREFEEKRICESNKKVRQEWNRLFMQSKASGGLNKQAIDGQIETDSSLPENVENIVSDSMDEFNLDVEEDPETILQTLKRKRNFTYQQTDLSQTVAEGVSWLKCGDILMSIAHVEEILHVYYNRNWVKEDQKQKVIGLARNETKSYFLLLTEDSCEETIIEDNTFVYRVGKIVVMSLSQKEFFKMTFDCKDDAIRFERDVLLLSHFHAGRILQLIGEGAAKQLLYKSTGDPEKQEKTQYYEMAEALIETAQEVDVDKDYWNLPDLNEEILQYHVFDKCKEFMDYAKHIEPYISKSCATILVSEDWCSILDSIEKTTESVVHLLELCIPRSEENWIEWSALCQSGERLSSVLNYHQKDNKLAEYYDEFVSLLRSAMERVSTVVDAYFVNISENRSGNPEEHQGTSKCIEVVAPSTSDKTNGAFFHIIAAMEFYLQKELTIKIETEALTFEIFEKLDEELMKGTESTFELMLNNLDALISQDIYTEHFWDYGQINISSELNRERVEVFKDLTKFAQKCISFDRESWMNLRAKRTECQPILELAASINSEYMEIDIPAQMAENNLSKWKNLRKFNCNEFFPIEEIADGGYGCANLCTYITLGLVVLKVYKQTVSDEEVLKEIEMTARLQGIPNIVKLHGFYYFSESDFSGVPIGIVMEYIKRSMSQIIHEKSNDSFLFEYNLKTALEQLKGVSIALEAMHLLNLIHRDLDPRNILVDPSGQVKICDFGTCVENINTNKTAECGKFSYMSPEMYGGTYDEKTDVYSLAITAWELFHRKAPYEGFSSFVVWQFVREGKRLEFNEEACPEHLRILISRSWNQDPTLRPSMTEFKESIKEILKQLPETVLQVQLQGSEKDDK